MRLFTGLDLPREVVQNLDQLLARLQALPQAFMQPQSGFHWIPPANLHITTKFIGAWPEERLAELQAALSGIPSRAAIPVHIRKLGFFPNPHSPRIFWCGVEAPGLDGLAAETDRAAAALGIASESRAFSPHLTLARIKPKADMKKLDLQPLREAIADLPSFEFGRFEADSFFLYQSIPRPTGSVYTKLAEFPLSKS